MTAAVEPIASPSRTLDAAHQCMPLADVAQALRASRGFQHKRDISAVATVLARSLPRGLQDTTLAEADGILLGDDCAAIPDGNGHLLFAIEGLVEDFVAHSPWFAGYSAVMVNLSDIAAMGGRALAVVDAIWSAGAEQAEPLLQGMAAASAAYGVPIVGGHSNHHAPRGQLAVAVLGRASALLSSFHARPGQRLMMAVDLRGQWEGSAPFWNASTRAPAQRLRADLAVLPELAEAGLCACAKDISMAGILGTAMMLAECSQVGARIDVSCLPHPAGHGPHDAPADWLRWLQAFPSYGYLLAVEPEHVSEVHARFEARGIACAGIGDIVAERKVWLTLTAHGHGVFEQAMLWDFAREPFIAARSEPSDVDARTLESLA